jgi:polyisoprenoid-binding protein YceI
MYLHLRLTLLLWFWIAGAALAQTKWNVQKSSVTFKIKNAGFNVDGQFGPLTEADLQFDPAKPDQAVLVASVEAKTINTNINGRDEHLRKPEYFDVAKFAKITLRSKKVVKQADGSYLGDFDLTLKGVTKPVKIVFTFGENPTGAVIKGSFKINRLDYGVGTSSWVMSDFATISLHLTVTKLSPTN